MTTRMTATLLGADSDMGTIHRRVVRVGALVAWIAAAVLLLTGFISWNAELLIEATGPALAASLMTVQILLKRENGGVALFASAAITVVMYGIAGNEDTLIPAALALVILPAIGTLFLDSHRVIWVAFAVFMLLAIPFIWGFGFAEALRLGVVMSSSFALTSVLVIAIRNSATSLNDRFQTLFENSPTAVLEEDWSNAVAHVRSEYSGRPDRIEPFLLAYPVVVRQAVAQTKVIRVNQAALRLLEADRPEDILGYRNGDVVNEATIELFASALAALYRGETSFSQEGKSQTIKERPIWLQARWIEMSTDSPASRMLIGLADITHIKAHTDAMEELVRAKDDFIARVSHELRTPLTAVVGLTSELNEIDDMSNEERTELMELVSGQAREMTHIVDDLLVAARAEIGTVAIDAKRVSLADELSATLDGLDLKLDDRPVDVGDIVADPGRVRQIIRNLLTNAQRYGGPSVFIRAGKSGDKVWLEIRDNGSGVPESERVRIFEPYSTAHRGVTGSVGLGLTVARQLAELMGGTLTYSRERGESVFRLELPALDSLPAAASTGAPH